MLKRLLLVLSINVITLYLLVSVVFEISNGPILSALIIISTIYLIILNIIPTRNISPNYRIYILASGCELLKLFLVALTTTVIIQVGVLLTYINDGLEMSKSELALQGFAIVYTVIAIATIFWNGIIRVYIISVQLGLKHRVLGILFGWVLGLNIYYLSKIIKICLDEVEVETQKIELNTVREESQICKTTYPILMVHGVFFRDFRYLNYWGRVPGQLQKNGATIFYGMQQSAATVDDCGKEIAQRIEEIVKETGCEKVNIIAHSKGGLDSRAAITKYGAAKHVASLTTINTPHHGCLFSEYLLEKMPEVMKNMISKTYNAALLKFGDKDPDFMGAVLDLTTTKCKEFNEATPNVEGVLYESYGSYCNRAGSGRFPLNFSYGIVKYFDGKNDGLVSTESAQWGSNFTLLEPQGRRGISHADLIDLNRENIKNFDVREFYVNLVENLKRRGY